jgi:hypothetical protein
MRGPLLSGPLGSAASLAALGRWTAGAGPVVVLGPVWLADALAASTPVLYLDEPDDRRVLVRAKRRAVKAARPLVVGIAGADVPLRRASVGALVVENAAGLPADEAGRWVEALVPCLRPGGRLIALDATTSPAAAARVAGVYLSAALTDIVQEWPREGVVITAATAPSTAVGEARFGDARFGSATATI